MSGAPPEGTWARLRALDHRLVDPLLAALLFAICLATLAGAQTDPSHPTTPDVVAFVLTGAACLALAVRTRHPLEVLAVCLVATTWSALAGYPEDGLPVVCMIALYTVAANAPRRQSVLGAAAVAAVIVGLTLANAQGLTPGSAMGNFAMFGVAFALGHYVRVRRAYLGELELRAAATDENRRRAAEQAVAEERLRIARELHDVVAHAMSVVAVQSGVAAHVIDREPGPARSMLETINETSRQALTEMRRLLGVLRSEGGAPGADLAPAPGLADLPALVASMDGTGVTVSLDVSGDARTAGPGVELTAYRLVQEALTNVVRHAGPAHVDVRVRAGEGEVAIDVVDDGRGAASAAEHDRAAPDPAGGGHGLIGMRERVDLYGGTLQAGPRAGGGFAVSAVLRADQEPVGA